IAPERLELEITESVAMLDAEFMVELINHIKQRGVRIAIDDFGTGFSSLSYLQQLQVDRLKIDLSFIRQLEHNEGSRRIVESIVQLGHSLQLQLLAEGIEQASQARRLVRMGCQEGQGYWFARPMPLDDLLQLVEQRANGSLQLPQEIAL
ncbi:MAG: EAL domain-containing protein, partial [Pseudomonas sp.]|nr:EAL domain-containing protein [Pseudomonas sp.]